MEQRRRTPGPLRVKNKDGKYWVVSDGVAQDDSRIMHGGPPFGEHEKGEIWEHYGGELICESCTKEDADFIALAWNNYEILFQALGEKGGGLLGR